MKRIAHIVIVSGLICSSVLIFSCSDSEHRLPYIGKNMAMVTIKLGLPGEQTSVSSSLIDRMLRIITRDAMAQTAPAAFSSYTVNVTAAGMIPIQQSFTSSAITLTVPAGTARTFEVIAYVSAGDPSAALSFRGTATMDLIAGQTMTVPIIMSLNETKIVVADYNKNRVVQIDSIANGPSTWKTDQLGLVSLYPYDIDFDSRGRIYIARNNASVPNPLIRIDNIDSTTFFPLIALAGTAIKTLAIDRKNHVLYYVRNDSTLYSISCNGGTSTSLEKVGINAIEGLAYDEIENVLYIAGTNTTPLTTLFKYSLNTFTVIDYYTNTSYLSNPASYPWHVLVKPPYIYATSESGPAGYKLIQFSTSLDLIEGYGSYGTTTAQGTFYGPRKFLAILNRKITLIDDGVTLDKLISMDNFNGEGWLTFGSYSGFGITDPNTFQFYISS